MKFVASTLAVLFLCTLSISSFGAEEKEKKGHHHHHKAPHGGCLVAVGDHFAHVEFVLDAATGKLTAYVLDGEAEKAVRIKQKEIKLKIEGLGDKKFELELVAVANVLSGEAVGDTSQFEATHEKLKGAKHFDGEIDKIEIKGQKTKNVEFDFPHGNEGGHDHKHEHKK